MSQILVESSEFVELDSDKCYLALFSYQGSNVKIGRRFLSKYYVVFNQPTSSAGDNQVGIARKNFSF